MNSRACIAVSLLAVLALAGCSAEPVAAPSTPAPVETPAPVATDSGEGVSEEPSDEPEGWTAPGVCTSIPIALGGTVGGTDLGACVQEALSSYGTGKERVSGDGLGGEVQFRYVPDFEFQGDLETGDGPIQLTFIDGTMWVDSGDGPVRGDIDSTDSGEQMAGLAGELYRVFSDPTFAGDLIASSAEWTVTPQLVTRELPSGDVVEAYELTSAAAFDWHELPIDEYVVWFTEDWTPVAAQSTATLFGFSDTTLQEFYDLGEPVDITPVA